MRREPPGLSWAKFEIPIDHLDFRLKLGAAGFKETLAQLEQDADREIEELKEMPLGFQDDLKSVTGSVDILYDCIVAHAGFRVARIVVKP